MSTAQKRPYTEMYLMARHIVEAIAPYCERVEIAGSLRRHRAMIGDIEIVALPKLATDLFGEPLPDAPTPLDFFLEMKRTKLTKNGSRFKQFVYAGVMVDLFLPESAAHWGTVFTIRTGSHDFNMWLMQFQQHRAGVMFSDGRLYDRQGGLALDTPEETDVFRLLHLDFVPPEDRDDRKWLAYAKEGLR